MNVISKQIFREEDFLQIGNLPKFFLPSEKKEIRDFELEMWPGFEVSAKLLRAGLYLNIDTATKFINMKPFLEELQQLEYDKGMRPKDIEAMYDSRNPDNPRITVITSYGKNRSYQIDGIDYSNTPESYKFKYRTGRRQRPPAESEEKVKGEAEEKMQVDSCEVEGSIIDYYKAVYNITIRDRKQPLVYINKPSGIVYIPTSLCHLASLPTNFT